MKRYLILISVFILYAGILFAGQKKNDAIQESDSVSSETKSIINNLKIGDKAPNFSLFTADEERFFMSRHFAPKSSNPEVLILKFMTTTCKPCIDELPIIKMIADKYKSKNVKVYLIFKEKISPDDLNKFLNKNKCTHPAAIDLYNIVSKSYGVEIVPHIFIIDKNQIVRWNYQGTIEKKVNEIENILESCIIDSK